jgi:hypothetical protein
MALTIFPATARISAPELARVDMALPSRGLPATIDAVPEFSISYRRNPARSGIDLSATMSAESGRINRPVQWTVYGMSDTARGQWEQLEDVSMPSPRFDLQPGNYVVQVKYGHVRTARRIEVRSGMVTEMTANLNVGGLRMVSRLSATPNVSARAEHLIYRIKRPGSTPELIGKSERQGAILRLAAGTYKVISRFEPGNTVKEATTRVRPGHLSAVEIDHFAGVATLAVHQANTAQPVHWVVTDETGIIIANTEDPRPVLILRSGTYTATATIGGKGIVAQFNVVAGESMQIEVGAKPVMVAE